MDVLDGRDPRLIARVLPFVRVFNRHYVRLRVHGREHLPSSPSLFVGNHNGGMAGPDLACTLGTLWEHHPRPLYALAHDFAMRQLTPFGAILRKFGAIRASHEHAMRAFESGASVLVYPGGDLDAYRHTGRRDEIVFGTRSGFVRLARAVGARVVPIVAHGAHRSAFVFHEGESIARAMRMPGWARLERFPLAFALPWGIAAGPWLPWMPLPFAITLQILPPIDVSEGTLDDARERVRTAMQTALTELAR
ncbi:MAG: 1-acyl-sn-glycerol-3-phosphate acyltransferase [Polyangiales bacterium]